MSTSLYSLVVLAALAAIVCSQSLDDQPASGYGKRAMRNALVRFGRAGGMRNALVRFGKRSGGAFDEYEDSAVQDKRNAAPQPFVRFGRSGHLDHMHDILSTLQKLEMANSK